MGGNMKTFIKAKQTGQNKWKKRSTYKLDASEFLILIVGILAIAFVVFRSLAG